MSLLLELLDKLAIAYYLELHLAKFFGKNTQINLNLLEITPSLNALKGVVMEVDDCAFPSSKIIIH